MQARILRLGTVGIIRRRLSRLCPQLCPTSAQISPSRITAPARSTVAFFDYGTRTSLVIIDDDPPRLTQQPQS